MTDDKKHDDKDRKKLSDEELEDVAGGSGDFQHAGTIRVEVADVEGKAGGTRGLPPTTTRSNRGD